MSLHLCVPPKVPDRPNLLKFSATAILSRLAKQLAAQKSMQIHEDVREEVCRWHLKGRLQKTSEKNGALDGTCL